MSEKARDMTIADCRILLLESVRMIKFAESLGGVETLITYPTTQTHADVPDEVRIQNGITPIEDLLSELSYVFQLLE